MMHDKRAMLASVRIMPCRPVQELNRENQNWYWGAPNQQICTIMSPPGTMNAVHDFIKCIEGLCMTHVKRAMLASGRIMPVWPVQELNRENQRTGTGGHRTSRFAP